jgi:transposase-like protein
MKTQSTQNAERAPKPHAAVRGRALIDDWRRSGLSRSAYARQHQVGAHLLSYWFKRLREPETSPALAAAPVTAPDFIQVSLPAPVAAPPSSGSASSAVEILFPRGVAVRIRPGVDLDLLRTVITALEISPC